MKTLRMTVDFTYDDELMHSGNTDKDGKEWFFNEVLTQKLTVSDMHEIGDQIGEIKVIDIKKDEKQCE